MDKALKRIDHIMYDVNTPTSLVTITGMMTFDKKIDKKTLQQIIDKRLLQYERFRKKVIHKNGKPYWHIDEHFELDLHLHHIALPAAGDYEILQATISDLISQPLDPSKPLWQAHLIDNYLGGSVILWRIHHAIADGIALIKVVLSLTGSSKAESLDLSLHLTDSKSSPERTHSLLEQADEWLHTGKRWYNNIEELFSDKEKMRDTLAKSLEVSKEVGKLFLGKAPKSILYKGELCCNKKVAFSNPLPLPDIKKIGKIFGATVNDILLALITGAIRRHLILHKQKLTESIRIVIPVNLRNKDEAIKIHNKIGMLSIELPVHITTAKGRILFIKEKTELLKQSIEPALIYYLMNIMADLLPKEVESKISDYLGKRIAGVITNVPGPRHAVYMAGLPVRDIMFWVPQTNPLGMGISIISYNDKVCLGVVTDTHLVSDPDKIIEGYYKEFDAMKKLLAGT